MQRQDVLFILQQDDALFGSSAYRVMLCLGIRRCFLLYPEWSGADAAAAAEEAGKTPVIDR